MKAYISLDRDATIKILKDMNIDIRQEIKTDFKKVIEREVKSYCDTLLEKTMKKYSRREAIDKIIKEAVQIVERKTDTELQNTVREVNSELQKCKRTAIDRARLYIRDYKISENAGEFFIKNAIKEEVKLYLDERFNK